MTVEEGAVKFVTDGPLTREDGARAARGFWLETDRALEELRRTEERRRGEV